MISGRYHSADDRRLQSDIDYHIEHQLAAWTSVAEYAALWPELDALDHDVFQLECTRITESRLHELQRWADQGCLSEDATEGYTLSIAHMRATT